MAYETVGRYRLTRALGSSFLGTVYEGQHTILQRRCRLRIISSAAAADKELLSRFSDEVFAANSVDHPGLCPMTEHGAMPDGSVYFVWEIPDGTSLQRRMEHAPGPLPLPMALRLGRQVAGALAAAHAKKLVHRDLQPDQILVAPDPDVPGGERAKLIDFGISNFARRWLSIQSRKQADLISIVGNPTYMSPEQCSGSEVIDERTDVYSLGAILFQMVTGRPPFVGDGFGLILGQHLFRDAPRASQLQPAIPPDVDTLIALMLKKRREDRPAMEQVARSLERLGSKHPDVRQPLPGSAASLPLVDPTAPTGSFSLTLSALRSLLTGRHRFMVQRRRWLYAALACALILLAGGLALSLRARHSAGLRVSAGAAGDVRGAVGAETTRFEVSPAASSAPLHSTSASASVADGTAVAAPTAVAPAPAPTATIPPLPNRQAVPARTAVEVQRADVFSAGSSSSSIPALNVGAGADTITSAARMPPPPQPVHATARGVLWTLTSVPSGAEVISVTTGTSLGHTPLRLQYPASDGLMSLIFRRSGYGDAKIILDRSQDITQEVVLSQLSNTRPANMAMPNRTVPVRGPRSPRPPPAARPVLPASSSSSGRPAAKGGVVF